MNCGDKKSLRFKINKKKLSIAQLLEKVYNMFENIFCTIKDSKDSQMFKIQMKGRRLAL